MSEEKTPNEIFAQVAKDFSTSLDNLKAAADHRIIHSDECTDEEIVALTANLKRATEALVLMTGIIDGSIEKAAIEAAASASKAEIRKERALRLGDKPRMPWHPTVDIDRLLDLETAVSITQAILMARAYQENDEPSFGGLHWSRASLRIYPYMEIAYKDWQNIGPIGMIRALHRHGFPLRTH